MFNDKKSKEELTKTLVRMFSLHPKLIDFNLSRIKLLLDKFDNPHNKLNKVIHIAGTNGKGSTASFLRSLLEAHGLSVNVYTSPHLINFNERIRIKGQLITNQMLINILNEIEIKNNKQPITFFEITTIAALISFFRNPADVNIIETGLGGRLDATNVIDHKKLCLITKIGYDHTEYLGKTITSITKEKAGILRGNIPLIIAKQNKTKVLQTLHSISDKIGAKIINRINLSKNYNLGLKGSHQYENASVAYTASSLLIPKIRISKTSLGLTNTNWHGRLEEINNGNIVKYRNNITLLDGTHNIDGAIAINKYLKENSLKKWNMIIGILNNRDLKKIVSCFKEYINIAYTIPIKNQISSSDPNKMSQELNEIGVDAYPEISFKNALIKSDREIPLLIIGSLYLVGEVLAFNNTTIT